MWMLNLSDNSVPGLGQPQTFYLELLPISLKFMLLIYKWSTVSNNPSETSIPG